MAYRDRLKTHNFTIPMTKKDMEELQKMADDRDVRKTELAREILTNWLRNETASQRQSRVAS